MNFSFLRFDSKSFWLGAVMIAAGIVEGASIPMLSDVIDLIWPNMSPDMLINSGLALIFLRDAIATAKK